MRVPPQKCHPELLCNDAIQGHAPSFALNPFTTRLCWTGVTPHDPVGTGGAGVAGVAGGLVVGAGVSGVAENIWENSYLELQSSI